MNSMHDAVQSRNGPAEAVANGERNADGDVGLALLVATRLRPPAAFDPDCHRHRRWHWRRRSLSLYQSEVTFIYLLQKII